MTSDITFAQLAAVSFVTENQSFSQFYETGIDSMKGFIEI